MIREHHRGRPLAEILEDHYVTNRLTPEQIRRLLERQDVIHAVGEDTVAATRLTAKLVERVGATIAAVGRRRTPLSRRTRPRPRAA